jgi:hypothetical protein
MKHYKNTVTTSTRYQNTHTIVKTPILSKLFYLLHKYSMRCRFEAGASARPVSVVCGIIRENKTGSTVPW